MAVPAVVALASLARRRAELFGEGGDYETLGLEGFGELWNALVADAVTQGALPDARYLAELGGLVQALRLQELPRMKEAGYQRDGLATKGVWGDGEVGIIELKLDPGAVIPAHNHVAYSFVTLCLEGDCEYRHFQPVGGPPPASDGISEWFRVEEVKSGVLAPGRITTLSRTWDNIHWFQAGKSGATLIDFMTHYPDPGAGYTAFSALEVDDVFAQGERRQRQARWVGNPFK